MGEDLHESPFLSLKTEGNTLNSLKNYCNEIHGGCNDYVDDVDEDLLQRN